MSMLNKTMRWIKKHKWFVISYLVIGNVVIIAQAKYTFGNILFNWLLWPYTLIAAII